MDTFEQQLARIVGLSECPICQGDDPVIAKCLEERYYDLYPLGNQDIDWEYNNSLQGPSDVVQIKCGSCNAIYWTAETGWIPELETVVRGE